MSHIPQVPPGCDAPDPAAGFPLFQAGRFDEPWLRTFARDLRDALVPSRLPPLDLTSAPVPVRDIWGASRHRLRAAAGSLAAHAALVGLLIAAGAGSGTRNVARRIVRLTMPLDLSAYVTPLKPALRPAGGGGGDGSPLPASLGQAPRFAPRQFVPPAVVVHNEAPKLLVEPTLAGPEDTPVPKVDVAVWGDPFARNGPLSNGPGHGGGIGPGDGGGIGPSKGPGLGPGSGDTGRAGAYMPRGGVSAPQVIYSVEPEYSEEARKAHFQGLVVLSVVVDEQGRATDFRILEPLGFGLDEKAVEAVRKWRFRPGKKDGKPVAVVAHIEIRFRLL